MTDYQIARININKTTKQKPSLWANDKYPNTPQLHPKSKVVLLDAEGPGVVTSIHTTRMSPRLIGEIWNWDSKYIKDIMLRIWYDNNSTPAIEIPFYDFFGDIQGDSNYFSTIYFSKVHRANNCRLLIPFRKHIKIEIENPTEISLNGLADVQYDLLKSFPKDLGYLRVAYVNGCVNVPQERIQLADIRQKGSIVASWLQLAHDDVLCKDGAVLCEGNNEFYIDGESHPSLEYLGTEDCYGYSWGFHQIESDFYQAIIKKETLKNQGAKISLIRCRDNDKISFNQSCRVVLDYTHEINPNLNGLNPDIKKALEKGDIDSEVISCIYYYSL